MKKNGRLALEYVVNPWWNREPPMGTWHRAMARLKSAPGETTLW